MTTHYQKIQALGERMASNLETMGVSASFSDGGLTLADKILQIQHFSDGLKLYADKSIDQSGNTVNLSALLFEDGKPQVGKTVFLYGESFKNTYSSETTVNEDIGSDWVIEWGNYTNFWICADGATIASGAGIISISGGSITIYKNNSIVHNGSISTKKLSYKDGVLKYDNSSVNISTYEIDVTNLYKVDGTVSVVTPTSLTTDSSGVATKSYTCTGAGKKEFYAVYGTLVSEIYGILDCILKDSSISNWRNPNSMPISESDGIITVSNSASSNKYLYAQLNSSQTYAHDFVIEMEYYGYTGTAITRVYNGTNADRHFSSMGLSNGDILEIKVTSDKVRYYKNGTEISDTAKDYTSDPSYFAIIINNGSISFKNFKIYPI